MLCQMFLGWGCGLVFIFLSIQYHKNQSTKPQQLKFSVWHIYPTLIIYVKHPELLQFILFVDDTNIFSAGETLQQLLWIFTQEMLQLKTWFDRNKLSLNLNKTTFTLFGNCKKDGGETLLINHDEVEQVSHA